MKRTKSSSARVFIITGALLVLGTASVATAAAISPSGQGSGAANSEPPSSTLPSEIAKGYDEAKAAGRISVADRTGEIRGYVPFDAVAGSGSFGDYPNGLIPVTSDSGEITGYFAAEVGFIDRAVVEQPGFNLAAYAQTVTPGISQQQIDNLDTRGPASASP